jgi:hypothetical protein
VQEPQLRDDEEQEDDAGAAGVQQVLPSLPSAHGTQRNQMTNDECGMVSEEVVFRSSFIIPHSAFLTGV